MYSRDNEGVSKKNLPLWFLKHIFLTVPFVVIGCSGPVEVSSFVPKLHMRRGWIHQDWLMFCV